MSKVGELSWNKVGENLTLEPFFATPVTPEWEVRSVFWPALHWTWWMSWPLHLLEGCLLGPEQDRVRVSLLGQEHVIASRGGTAAEQS